MPKDDVVIDSEMIKAELKKIGDQVKEAGEKALAEAKKHGDMYAADKPKVDEMLVKQGELQARLFDVEQKMARPQADVEPTKAKTLGQRFTETEEARSWATANAGKNRIPRHSLTIQASILHVPVTETTTIGVPPDNQSGIVGLPQRPLRIRDLMMPGTTESDLIRYMRQTGFTNNAAPVTEGERKPESTLTYEMAQSPVVTLAHVFKASKQILADFKQLQSEIDGWGRYGLAYVEEQQLLHGSGVGENLDGVYTQATAYSAPPGSPGSPTKIDRIRLMILQASIALFPPNGIVLNPSDWAFMELTKDDLGRYIIGNPQGTIQPTLWGLPVVATWAMTQDTALVGAFQSAQIFDRERVSVDIATENEDDFVKNMVTIRIEERLALVVKRPEAFIKDADLPAT